MKAFAIALFAFIALASADDVTQGSSVNTLNVGPDGSVVASAVVADSGAAANLSPIVSSLLGPTLRTININSDGTHVNNVNSVGVVATGYSPFVSGLHVPSVRTVNVGPDGSFIDSSTVAGVLAHDGSVLVAPSVYSPYFRSANQVLYHGVVPNTIPGTGSFVYTPGYYSNYGYVQVPYGKTIVTGESGIIVAK